MGKQVWLVFGPAYCTNVVLRVGAGMTVCEDQGKLSIRAAAVWCVGPSFSGVFDANMEGGLKIDVSLNEPEWVNFVPLLRRQVMQQMSGGNVHY
jgi:hypothetical protein